VEEGRTYDIVCASEVVEHVTDPSEFVKILGKLVKLDGVVILSTINRNIISFIGAIALTEYIMGWNPKGTHDYYKLVQPEELDKYCTDVGLELISRNGI
jgi:2-polyprenyl-6-hydroxyphenyl methylase / 3-demethylubiquinone-9 3-methyltransferase